MISLVVAMARNRVIGAANKLPWDLPEDLRRFRAITSGHPVVMGRKTFESIGRPLPKRTNIVITRDRSREFPGALAAGSLEEALALAAGRDIPGREEICVIGGAEIYRQALARADRIYLTRIERDIEGDAFFPEIDARDYREISRERGQGSVPFEFLVLERAWDRK